MSISIEQLIEDNPAELRLGASIESIVGSASQQRILSAVNMVLTLFRESKKLELKEKDRKVLELRLRTAAGRLQDLIDYDDFHGRGQRNRNAQENLKLFLSIAAELNMEPQRLQTVGM